MLAISQFGYSEYKDGSVVPTCLTQASTFWPKLFFAASVALFFVVPLGLLLGLYGSISKRLMCNVDCSAALTSEQGNKRARRQVVLLLGTVVLIFFMCLLPFRALTLWLIFSSDEHIISLGVETYFNILYFCRTMHYLNSALNPILYNVMSSKFRSGFADLCGLRRRRIAFLRGPRGMSEVGSSFLRNGTFHTTSSWTSNSCNRPLQAQHRSAPNLLTWRSDSSLSSVNSETFTPSARTRQIRCTLPREKSLMHNGISNTATVTNLWKGRNSSFRRNAMLRSTMIDLNERIRKADLNTPLDAEAKV